MNNVVLVTGAAGFIGYHLCNQLLDVGKTVVGFDNINDYYDPNLKLARLKNLKGKLGFSFVYGDLTDEKAVNELFQTHAPFVVVHLAAQAGVRYSIENPRAYVASNVVGFLNILEACRNNPVHHLLYASSSSVYGNGATTPYSVDEKTDSPVSLYAATKKADELMAYTYSHLYKMPATGLRFFTVYGPYGRPDMAYFSFTKNILSSQPIKIFNHGDMYRDFTYIDDVVEGIMRMLDHPPQIDEKGDCHRVFNIGNNRPEQLMHFIQVLENCLGMEAKKEFLPMQPGDVYETYADIEPLKQAFGFSPSTPIEIGLEKFTQWYRSYYQ